MSAAESIRAPAWLGGERIPLAMLTLAWWIAVAIVDASGDFPLNDDWGYGPAAQALVERGTLSFTDWQSMPLLSHALWGALFCVPFGFSYTALRIATLTAGWLGVLAMYALCRQLGASRRVSCVGAATLAFNPLYFVLSASFMTDVPFVAALIGATAAWLRADEKGSVSWRAIAVALAIVATLNRQLGIALPIAWAIAGALREGLGWRWAIRALLPAALVLASLVIYEQIVLRTIGMPALYHAKTDELREAIGALVRLRGLRFPLERSGIVLMYLGLFAAPLSGLAWRRVVRSELARWAPAIGAIGGAALAIAGAGMPLTINVWSDFALGPRTAPGIVEHAPRWVSAAITAASGAGAIALLVIAYESARAHGVLAWARNFAQQIRQIVRRERDTAADEGAARLSTWLLLALTPLIAFAPTAIAYGAFFDRYVLVQLPFALALIVLALDRAPAIEPASWRWSAFALTLMIAFAVPGTHDYLAWQRARWAGVARLEQRGVARDRIDGGFEVDNHPPLEGSAIVERPKAPWAIAISELPGAETVDRIEVRSWLPWSIDAIHLVRRPEKR